MSRPMKRPPLPQRRGKAAVKITAQSERELGKQSDSKIKSGYSLGIDEEVMRKIYQQSRLSCLKSEPSSLDPNPYQTSISSRPQKKQKRGLLKECKNIERGNDSNNATSHFISSFNSIQPGKGLRPKRIIRIHSEKSISKQPLFESGETTPLDKKLQILKEENQFYRKVSRESRDRLSSLQKQLQKSKSDFQSEKQEMERKLRRLKREVEYRQSSITSSHKIANSKLSQRSKLIHNIS